MNKSKKNLFEMFPPVSTEAWLEKVKKDLKGKAIESLNWELEEGLSLKPFYRSEDLDDLNVTANFQETGSWLISETFEVEKGVTGTKKCNTHLKSALNAGVEAPVINIDHVIDKKAIKALLKGIHPEMIYLGFSGLFPEADPVGFLNLVIAEFQNSGNDKSALKGNLQLDPVGFFIENGEFYESQTSDFENLEKAIRLVGKKLPAYRMIQVNMHFLHHQGSEISRELAVALATGSEYLAQLTNLGLDVDDIHPKIAFSLSAGNQYFPTITKIRALKGLWLKVLEGYGAKSPAFPWVSAQTSLSDQSVDQYLNMIQATTASMAAVLGGADVLLVNPSDKTYGTPNDFSRRISRNVQHILREESHFGKVENPVSGSYYIEMMTSKLMEKAWGKFQKIEARGGILAFLNGE